ncbi:MAG TPA: redoxin domain-containing protein [Methylomirabilota bacterium]|jgi:peroxiredoxin|nr:redoxin domain-containing protein [Methylomirabilota bacterium]
MPPTGIQVPSSLQPGQPAPDFSLPAIHREGKISLADYKGRTPLLLALFRGVYCPFCRRAIAQLGRTADKLKAAGVETLGVVATQADRARLYFRYHPTRLPLAADPDLATLRAFRVPKPEATPQLVEQIKGVRTDVGGELSEPMPIMDALNALDEKDRFEHTPADNEEMEKQFGQLVGQFLLDRDGIIRWVNIEAREGLAGLGKFPSDDEFLAAAAALRA